MVETSIMKELKELVENLAKKLQLQDMCLVNEIKGIFQQKHIFMVILQHLSRTSFFLPWRVLFQAVVTCSESTMETPEQYVESAQS